MRSYDEAETLFKRSLAISEKTLGPERPRVASVLDDLAQLYFYQGKQTAAEPLYKRALAIYEKVMGPGHLDVADELNNLGNCPGRRMLCVA